MLLRFGAANHRSILKPIELSMIAVDEDRPTTRGFDSIAERVLTVAAVYGPNASGKSNVLDALSWLSTAVQASLRGWDQFIPRDPFKFGDGPTSPSIYEVDAVVGGVRYAYTLELDDSKVLFEGLYSYPERRRRVLFEREGTDIRFRRGLGALSGTRELLTSTTLALSAAMRFNDEEVAPFARYLSGVRVLGVPRQVFRTAPMVVGFDLSLARFIGSQTTEDLFKVPGTNAREAQPDDTGEAWPEARESALALLRLADLGIDDVEITEQPGDPPREGARPRREVRLTHRADGQERLFNLGEESAGTQTWFSLIGPALVALRHGQVFLVDEIDASLHPRLSARLLDLFQDRVTNPHGAQLIFTTHDTTLLNHLNRDEVWLTEKGESGTTTLTALAEYGGDKVRRSLNLEKAYLQGRFGAVPEIDQFALQRALGLLTDDAG
jgi:energy-coupling factor transporter ATP-binding protein EcfA2